MHALNISIKYKCVGWLSMLSPFRMHYPPLHFGATFSSHAFSVPGYLIVLRFPFSRFQSPRSGVEERRNITQ